MPLMIPKNRPFDAICLGRAGIDLYALERHLDFSQTSGFSKHVGGSAANIAVAMVRLNNKVGFIGAVSKDMVGNYVRDYLSEEGIDVTGLKIAPEGSRTSLALTELKAEDCGVVIYRNSAADLYLSRNDIDPAYIGAAKMLVVTGTALAQAPSRIATLYAMKQARKQETVVVLDLDYRAYSWESLEKAAEVLRYAASLSDMLIGNREEFDVITTGMEINSNCPERDDVIAKALLRSLTRIVVVKAGAEGSRTYTGDGHCIQQAIFAVDVLKPFGAGDAFLGTLLSSLIQGNELKQGLELAAASAAINVASDNCTAAMPSLNQIYQFIENHTTGAR